MDEAMKFAQSELERISAQGYDVLNDAQALTMLIARAWEQGFGAARASKPAIEEILTKG